MLSVVDTAIPGDINGQHAVLVIRDDFLQNNCLVDDRAHRKRVVARHEYKVGEGRIADIVAFDVGIKRYITL